MADIGSLHDAQTAAALDNKQNMEQREQYYATVRKTLRSPINEMGTLERIPGKNNPQFFVCPSKTFALIISFASFTKILFENVQQGLVD